MCLSVRDDIFGTTRPTSPNFCACYLWPWLGPRTHGTTFRALKVTFRVATPEAESAVYDWLVCRRVVMCKRFCRPADMASMAQADVNWRMSSVLPTPRSPTTRTLNSGANSARHFLDAWSTWTSWEVLWGDRRGLWVGEPRCWRSDVGRSATCPPPAAAISSAASWSTSSSNDTWRPIYKLSYDSSQDYLRVYRLAIVTYNGLSPFLEMLQVSLRTLSPTTLRFCK